MEDAVSFLRSLTPAEEPPPEGAFAVNAHVHLPPNFCDFDGVEDAVERSAAAGVGVLGVSNYYSTACFQPFSVACRKHRVFPLFGMEAVVMKDDFARAGKLVNDPKNPGKMYVCAKGLTRFNPPPQRAAEILHKAAKLDNDRAEAILGRLRAFFQERGALSGLEAALDFNAVRSETARRASADIADVVLQERHLVRALDEALRSMTPAARTETLRRALGDAGAHIPAAAPAAAQNELRNALLKFGKPGYVEERYIAFEDMRVLTEQMGGVLVYPTVADGMSPIAEFEKTPELLADNVEALGLLGLEFIPPRNSPACLRNYVLALHERGFFVTAGTEHNAPNSPSPATACKAERPLDAETRAVLTAGAYALAAHQFRRVRDEPGLESLVGLAANRRREALREWSAFGARVVGASLAR